jgi:carbonic anhydrase
MKSATGNTVRLDDVEIEQEWQRFFTIAQTLKNENDSTIFNLNLDLLMGETLTDFWRYEGSLTTPPCTEGIIWTLFKQEIIFVESEFQSFRNNLYFEDYRRPQPLYNRTVYRNFFNETVSPIPDYNCCVRKGSNNQLTSSFEIVYYSMYLMYFGILSFIFI